MLDYQKNYTHKTAKRERKVYKKLLAQYHQLLSAADEGVFEITVRSQSGAITVPVSLGDGGQLTADLVDCFAGRIQLLERNLNNSLIEIGFETKKGREKKQKKQAQWAAETAAQVGAEGRLVA
ncbi:hypothetical protein GO988_17255 [Hymenobacter sp. HMF4947]|uniref:Uncharacterized protein n=1 Tax=Hymenobacter ginkgonis TaxID=2682976 RepID=A0A7K1TI37_9BACT|nr:hypothetical protein [Hymenobacter ginkgonis]MVN78080.1 hypothetical protein [Hymenobacter ginkgonis]